MGYKITDSGDIFLYIKLTPNARCERLSLEVFDDGEHCWHLAFVSKAPEKGKANKALIKLLNKTLKIPQKELILFSGEHARKKIFAINKMYTRSIVSFFHHQNISCK